MLLSLLFSFSTIIDCELLNLSEKEKVPWQDELCKTTFEHYENVVLKPIRTTSRATKRERNFYSISEPKGGRLTITYIVEDEGMLVEATTYFQFKAERDVWVSRKDIKPNSGLKARWFKKEKRDVAKYLGIKQLAGGDKVQGFSERGIRKGNILFEDQIQSVPLVRNGEKLMVVLSNNSIEIRMEAVALQSVYEAGENIQVRILETGKIISGEINESKIVNYSI